MAWISGFYFLKLSIQVIFLIENYIESGNLKKENLLLNSGTEHGGSIKFLQNFTQYDRFFLNRIHVKLKLILFFYGIFYQFAAVC